MKYLKLNLLVIAIIAFSALTANAAQLATAKVIGVEGTAVKISPDGSKSPLTKGEILKQGDIVTTTELSTADLVFSNGSTMTVESGSSLKIESLEQESYNGNKTYEDLQADPSVSQTMLVLDYGKVSGHVKKLAKGSNFHVKSMMGTAAIRGTLFTVSVGYDPVSGNIILTIVNIDGSVDVMDLINGEPGGPIQPNNAVVISISQSDPNYAEIIQAIQDSPVFRDANNLPPLINVIPGPIITPEDAGEVVISPEI